LRPRLTKTISLRFGPTISLCNLTPAALVLFLLLLFPILLRAQAGGHTLFGDVRIDENQTNGLKPLFLQVLLYSEDGRLVTRQTISSNGRYRFLDLRDGRYDVVVEVENVEVARVRVAVSSPFKTDFRQDLEFQWREKSVGGRAEVISAADVYERSAINAELLRQAQEAGEKKNFDRAITLLRQIVKTDPKDFTAWTELGTTYFIKKNFEGAEYAYKEALNRHPDYAIALISLGRVRIVQKNFNGAIEVLTHAIEVAPGLAQANYFLGEAYLQVKLGSKAVPYLNQALKLDPVNMAEAHLRLAALYHAGALKGKAAAEYEAFLKLRPDYPEKKKLREYIAANKKM
jgi:cytochrome c-type biogenesis protein CcmH/NrfG